MVHLQKLKFLKQLSARFVLVIQCKKYINKYNKYISNNYQ